MGIDLLTVNSLPKPVEKNVISASLPARVTALGLLSLQSGQEIGRGQLAARMGMDDRWLTPTFQCQPQKACQ